MSQDGELEDMRADSPASQAVFPLSRDNLLRDLIRIFGALGKD